MEKAWNLIKEHPYITGIVVLIAVYLLFFRGSGASSGPSDAQIAAQNFATQTQGATDLAVAQAAQQAQQHQIDQEAAVQQATIAGNVSLGQLAAQTQQNAQQLQAGVLNSQIAGAVQINDSNNSTAVQQSTLAANVAEAQISSAQAVNLAGINAANEVNLQSLADQLQLGLGRQANDLAAFNGAENTLNNYGGTFTTALGTVTTKGAPGAVPPPAPPPPPPAAPAPSIYVGPIGTGDNSSFALNEQGFGPASNLVSLSSILGFGGASNAENSAPVAQFAAPAYVAPAPVAPTPAVASGALPAIHPGVVDPTFNAAPYFAAPAGSFGSLSNIDASLAAQAISWGYTPDQIPGFLNQIAQNQANANIGGDRGGGN
jgi:hypothetical protein